MACRNCKSGAMAYLDRKYANMGLDPDEHCALDCIRTQSHDLAKTNHKGAIRLSEQIYGALIAPDRKNSPAKRQSSALGCASSGCVFHPNRRSGTTGICSCPGAELSEAEQEFLHKLMTGWPDEVADTHSLLDGNYK